MKKPPSKSRKRQPRRDVNAYPTGWNLQRVRKVIDFYDRQCDESAILEAEAAYGDKKTTMMQIPNHLVPKVQKLIGKRAG